MPNPVFNEETMKRDANGWAAPVQGTQSETQPATDGPISGWQKAMTVNGTISAAASTARLPSRTPTGRAWTGSAR